MVDIIKHGIAMLNYGDLQPVTFKCDNCKCTFKTDEFISNFASEFGFTPIWATCPECPSGRKVKKYVRTSFLLKQVKTKGVDE